MPNNTKAVSFTGKRLAVPNLCRKNDPESAAGIQWISAGHQRWDMISAVREIAREEGMPIATGRGCFMDCTAATATRRSCAGMMKNSCYWTPVCGYKYMENIVWPFGTMLARGCYGNGALLFIFGTWKIHPIVPIGTIAMNSRIPAGTLHVSTPLKMYIDQLINKKHFHTDIRAAATVMRLVTCCNRVLPILHWLISAPLPAQKIPGSLVPISDSSLRLLPVTSSILQGQYDLVLEIKLFPHCLRPCATPMWSKCMQYWNPEANWPVFYSTVNLTADRPFEHKYQPTRHCSTRSILPFKHWSPVITLLSPEPVMEAFLLLQWSN